MIATLKQSRPIRGRVARVSNLKRRLGALQEHLTSIGVRSRSTERDSREFTMLSYESLVVMRKLVAMKMLYTEALRHRGAVVASERKTLVLLGEKIDSFGAACRASDCPKCRDWVTWSEGFLARLEPRMRRSASVRGNAAASRAWLTRFRELCS